jgi:hypothetical protein
MKIRKLGLEWGAAYDLATPLLITGASLSQLLVYEAEGGDLVVEIPLGCDLNVYETTLTEHEKKDKGERVLVVHTNNGFDYVPKPRK